MSRLFAMSRLVLRTAIGLTLSTLLVIAVVGQPRGGYPSLSEQLEKEYNGHKVELNSELASFIAQNQDFGLLRADEFNDKRGLPPWLRVWWRKMHPEGEYTESDPTKGYPLVLKEILEWMITHQDLKAGPGLGESEKGEDGEKEKRRDSPLVDSLTGADYAPKNGIGNKDGENFVRALIGTNIRTSGAQTVPRSESDVRINYFNPTKILIGSNNIGGSGQQGIYRSTDTGVTWAQTTLPFTGGDTSHSDPTVDWTSDGRAWSSTLGIQGGTLRMRNYVSTDDGATWAFEATPSGTQTNVDKQMVWIDKSSTSPFFNQTYATWHNGAPAFANRRTAGAGGTWLAAPIQVSGAESTGTAIGGDIKSNSAGDVFVFWPTTTNRLIIVRKSTDGGNTYAAPVQIATTFDGFDIGIPSFNSRRAFIYVSGATYRNATKNLVYASWTDLSGDAGCTAAANEPGSNTASTCKMRVFFSRSTDGGATWSPKVKINNQAGLNDQFSQWLAVDETTGALGIIYNDTVGDPGRLSSDIWYQRSFDDGQTWSAAEKVTTALTNETSGGADTGNQYGDYNALSAYAGILFPSWTDRRSGAREEIWTAKITDPACTAPGEPTGTTATATAANQITVSWVNGTPNATGYNVYRATGTCAAPGPYSLIASNVATTSYVDGTVSGGTTYSYRITGKDGTGNCESVQSTCSGATATGACTLAPTFAGVTTVNNAAGASCQLNISWAPATPNCAGPVSYNVYRSTTSGFTPGPANLIGTTSSTNYPDSNNLISGTTYYYVVRAKDNGNLAIDTNTVQRSGTPTGPVAVGTFTETFEGVSGFDNPGWTHQAIAGTVDWVSSTAQSQTPTHSWFSDSLPSTADRVLVTPSLGITATTTLSFWHTYAFELGSGGQCFDGGTLEYSTNGTTWTVIPDANFTLGGFNGTAAAGTNPIAGRRAYCGGTIGAMTQVNVNLGFLAGNNAQIRFHAGDDVSIEVTGWFVDSVTVTNVGTAAVCSPFTAAEVQVSGRVLSPEGRGVTNATVTITNDQGQTRSVVTGRNGRFTFNEVESGRTYVVSVASRRFSFSPRVIQVDDNISDLDFYPEQ